MWLLCNLPSWIKLRAVFAALASSPDLISFVFSLCSSLISSAYSCFIASGIVIVERSIGFGRFFMPNIANKFCATFTFVSSSMLCGIFDSVDAAVVVVDVVVVSVGELVVDSVDGSPITVVVM